MTPITPEEGQIYYYFSGGLYLVLGVGRHTETGETMVCYKAILGDERPVLMTPVRVWNKVVEYNGRVVKKFSLMHTVEDEDYAD